MIFPIKLLLTFKCNGGYITVINTETEFFSFADTIFIVIIAGIPIVVKIKAPHGLTPVFPGMGVRRTQMPDAHFQQAKLLFAAQVFQFVSIFDFIHRGFQCS